MQNQGHGLIQGPQLDPNNPNDINQILQAQHQQLMATASGPNSSAANQLNFQFNSTQNPSAVGANA